MIHAVSVHQLRLQDGLASQSSIPYQDIGHSGTVFFELSCRDDMTFSLDHQIHTDCQNSGKNRAIVAGLSWQSMRDS
jgi:hypothetical protein